MKQYVGRATRILSVPIIAGAIYFGVHSNAHAVPPTPTPVSVGGVAELPPEYHGHNLEEGSDRGKDEFMLALASAGVAVGVGTFGYSVFRSYKRRNRN